MTPSKLRWFSVMSWPVGVYRWINAVDIDYVGCSMGYDESLIFKKFISCRHWGWSVTRWVNNTLGSNHWLAIVAMWAGDLLAQALTSQILLYLARSYQLKNCSRSIAIKSLTFIIPSLLAPKILLFFKPVNISFFSGFVLIND